MLRAGTLIASGGGSSTGTFWFFDNGQLSLNGTHTFSPSATMYGSGGLTIAGGIIAIAAPVALNGMLNVSSGSVSFDSGASFTSATNTGTLSLGSSTLTLSGVYSQGTGGTLNVRMDSDTQFGRINAAGAVSLAGALNVTWGSGYIPAAGVIFNFINASTRLSTFAATNLSALSGRSLQLNYLATGVSLAVS
jgi:hypothetical protein